MTTHQYKIEKGVPLTSASKWKDLYLKMEAGDSVFVKTKKERNSLWHCMFCAKIKAASRREGTGFRIWRTA